MTLTLDPLFLCFSTSYLRSKAGFFFSAVLKVDQVCLLASVGRWHVCPVQVAPAESDWSESHHSRNSRSSDPLLSLHSFLARLFGSSSVLECLLLWHPRHKQWHTHSPMMSLTQVLSKSSDFFFFLRSPSFKLLPLSECSTFRVLVVWAAIK